jgi:hypothetical protein
LLDLLFIHDLLQVDMVVQASASVFQDGSSHAKAFIDPVFALSDTDAQNFHLEYSPNLAFLENTPAVPEPSTWAMLLMGLAGISLMAHRRKNKAMLQTA